MTTFGTVYLDRIDDGVELTPVQPPVANQCLDPVTWGEIASAVAHELEPGELAVMPAGDTPADARRVLLMVRQTGKAGTLGVYLDRSAAAALIGRIANALEACSREGG